MDQRYDVTVGNTLINNKCKKNLAKCHKSFQNKITLKLQPSIDATSSQSALQEIPCFMSKKGLLEVGA